MPTISWTSILSLIGGAVNARNDIDKWSAEFLDLESGEKSKATVEEVSLEAVSGLRLKLTHGDASVEVSAKPVSASTTRVYVDGELDPEAKLVFAYKGSPGNPSRWAFDFRPVTIGEREYRVNTRFDP